MKRFLSILLAMLLTLSMLAACGSDADVKDEEAEEKNEENETEEESENETEKELEEVPASKSATEDGFTLTASAENTVFSLADIKSGKLESLNYKFTLEYNGEVDIVIARRNRFSIFNVFGADGSEPFGVGDMIYTFTNVLATPGFKYEESATLSGIFEDVEVGEYVVECSVMFTTDPIYFAEEYQAPDQEIYPTDAQLAEGGKTYEIEIELPLTIVE